MDQLKARRSVGITEALLGLPSKKFLLKESKIW